MVDFLVTCDDGVAFRLHPNYNENKIRYNVVKRTSTPAPIPESGICGTDGPGTFRNIIGSEELETLKFDMPAVQKAQGNLARREATPQA